MVDTPANQAPVEDAVVAHFYGRGGAAAGLGFVKYAANQVANAVGKTAANKGELFHVDANGDVDELAPGTNGNFLFLADGLASWTSGVNIAAGVFSIGGSATQGMELRLFEDTDNGVNYVGLKVADALGSSITFTLPSADGTPGQALVTNGSGTLGFGTSGITANDARRITQKYALIV